VIADHGHEWDTDPGGVGPRSAQGRRATGGLILVLDSTVLIDYLRGRQAGDRVDEHLRVGDTVATTAVNVEEALRGFVLEGARRPESLFAGLFILSIGRSEGWRAGTWRRDFATRGKTLSQSDCLIAAATYSAGARLATGNPRGFPMDGLAVEHWPVG
jgi:predicted nucleic acid-binding protein